MRNETKCILSVLGAAMVGVVLFVAAVKTTEREQAMMLASAFGAVIGVVTGFHWNFISGLGSNKEERKWL